MIKKHVLISVAVIAAMTAVLLVMGRIPFCKCGEITLWSSDVTSSSQSQQLADPYTFTHVMHGLAFYLLVWLFARKYPVGARLIMAVVLESGWEILENTDLIINRYRSHTFSYDYYGDSVFNSVGDVLAMMLGFWMAVKLPWWGSLLAFIAIDSALLFFIRDSLIVNIIMLISPIEAIKTWQMQSG